jgi:O-antigen/teichoic acid export membrane protein
LVSAITIPSAALNAVLNYLLIPSYGKVGAAVASLITMVILSLVVIVVSVRVKKLGYRWGRMLAYTTGAFGLSLVVYLHDSLPSFFIHLAVKVAICLVVCASVLLINHKRLIPVYQMFGLFKARKSDGSR